MQATHERFALITPDRLLELIATGEWDFGDHEDGRDTIGAVTATTERITIERVDPDGEKDLMIVEASAEEPLTVRLYDGYVRIFLGRFIRKITLTHRPTHDASVKLWDERHRRKEEEERIRAERYLAPLKAAMIGARIIDITHAGEGVTIVCDDGRSLVIDLTHKKDGEEHKDLALFYIGGYADSHILFNVRTERDS